MEALKLAFETVMVGLFALPALLVMIELLSPGLFRSPGLAQAMAWIPSEVRPPAIGLALFSIVYLLGSMITPVASEFLNDPDMLGNYLPTEEKMEAWTYTQMPAPPRIPGLIVPEDISLVGFAGAGSSPEEARQAVRAVSSIHDEFQHEESALLLRGSDVCERLNRLHEQLNVLRGATFSAFALSALCLFAWCGRPGPLQQLRRFAGLAASAGLVFAGVRELLNDIHHPEAGDMPVAELVFLAVGGFGVYVLIWGARSRLRFHGPACLLALCFAAICYAGFGSVATTYDQTVFNQYRALPPSSEIAASAARGFEEH